jgi:hypothetical protein
MHSKKVYRYYCDFCRRSGCNSGHIRRHEESCTHNLNRVCRMCAHAAGEPGTQRPIPELVAALDSGGLDELRRTASGCPVCMLAAITHWRKREVAAGVYGEDLEWEFSFDAEEQAVWDMVNNAQYETSVASDTAPFDVW